MIALKMMSNKGSIHQIMKSKDIHLWEKIKKVIGLIKYELDGEK